MSDLRTTYERARGEVAAMLGFKLAELTPEQTLRLDCAVALRLALDDLQGRIVRGESIDIAKMLTASEALARLLPPTVLASPPAVPERDPREVMLDELRQMRERNELYEVEVEAKESDRLRERVAELEAELAALKGERVPAEPAPAEPAPPAGDSNVVSMPQRAGPPGWTNGLADVPRHVRDTRPANEPWRDYVGPDGDISMRPRGDWGFP